MKSDKQWGDEVARSFRGLGSETREAIAVSVARTVRKVRREMDDSAAWAIECFTDLTDRAAGMRRTFDDRKVDR